MDYKSSIEEAIHSLGYLRLEALPAIIKAIESAPNAHPRDRARFFRKQGNQLSADEKRALGLRANTLFSREAFDCLTERGRDKPIEAIENTFLRAVFTDMREGSIRAAEQELHRFGDSLEIRVSAPIAECPGCQQLDNKPITPEQARTILPPDNCIREACPITLQTTMDWIEYGKAQEVPKKGFFRRLFGG